MSPITSTTPRAVTKPTAGMVISRRTSESPERVAGEPPLDLGDLRLERVV